MKIEYPKMETPRLRLRELTLQDADDAMKHFSDPEIIRFMDIEHFIYYECKKTGRIKSLQRERIRS